MTESASQYTTHTIPQIHPPSGCVIAIQPGKHPLHLIHPSIRRSLLTSNQMLLVFFSGAAAQCTKGHHLTWRSPNFYCITTLWGPRAAPTGHFIWTGMASLHGAPDQDTQPAPHQDMGGRKALVWWAVVLVLNTLGSVLCPEGVEPSQLSHRL